MLRVPVRAKTWTDGEGIGGSVLLPVIQKYVDFTGNVMYGRGIGRYGSGQLPDVTIASDGSLSPLTELTAMVGLIGHPWDSTDKYTKLTAGKALRSHSPPNRRASPSQRGAVAAVQDHARPTP